MSNFYDELDIESVLQCPVCYELPQNDIFLCKIGHHMCDRCKKRLPSCPTCQAALTSSRNFLAEALISKFSIFKDGENKQTNNNQLHDDPKDSSVTDVETNNNKLMLPMPSGSYRCMLEACRHREGMGATKLIPHLEITHKALFEKFKNKTGSFTHNFNNFCLMKKSKKYHRAFQISNMGLFFLNLEVLEDNYINCWISTAAPIKQANRFECEIEFNIEESGKKIKFADKIASTMMDTEWLLKRARVFIISPASHGLKNGDFFSIYIKIVYRPPRPSA